MGPFILLDKSALQYLSKREISFLFKHYYIVIPPILIIEIMADLSKDKKKAEVLNEETNRFSQEEVRHLSNKLQSGDSQINADYVRLCIASLTGHKVEMSVGRPVVEGGTVLETETGEKGIFLDEPLERKIIRNWQQGIFSDKEHTIAKLWRKVTSNIDLEYHRAIWKEIFKDIPRVKSLNELGQTMNTVLLQNDSSVQFSYLNFFLNRILNVSLRIKNYIVNKWWYQKPSTFKEFAPYAYYCFKINMFFYLGLANDLITTRSTNVLDLQYLYYLPFCWIFSSGDKVHRDLFPLLKRDDQVFVERELLKKDLAWLADDWNALDEKGREERFYDYGNYPPDNSDSFTSKVWKRYMKPWKPGSGNIRMTPEQEKRVMEHLKPFLDAIKRHEERKGAPMKGDAKSP